MADAAAAAAPVAATSAAAPWIARITIVPCIEWDHYKMSKITSAVLVFAFPGCIHQVVTADGGLQHFLRTDIINLCSMSKTSNPRYANSVERSRCTSCLFPGYFRGKQDKLAFDRTNFAAYVRFTSAVKLRGVAATQVATPPIPIGTLFGDGMTHLFEALDTIHSSWATAMATNVAAAPFCCEFYHSSRTPLVYGLEKALTATESITVATAPRKRSRSEHKDEPVANTPAADYDPDEENDDVRGVSQHGRKSAWTQLAERLFVPAQAEAESRLAQSITEFIQTVSVGASSTSPFLTVQAIADHIKAINTHQLCELLVSLGYFPWYFNRLQPTELSLFGIHTNAKQPSRLFILDEAAERRVLQLQRTHVLPKPSTPTLRASQGNGNGNGTMSRSTSESSSFANLLHPMDFSASLDGLFQDLSQGIRSTPLHKVQSVEVEQ